MEKSATFRPDIQALRALAVSLVVVFHSGLGWLPGGYVGVDIFFVISGFLITKLLLDEQAAHGRIRLLAFYARRLRRLLPAAAVVLASTITFALTVYAPLPLKTFSSDALATAAYVSNFWFAHLATDYLATDEPSLLLHTWSLSVEEQFYLLWPAVLIVALKFGPTGARRRLLVAMTVIAAASFAGNLVLTAYAQAYAFFASPTRAFEFAFGAMVAVAAPAGVRLPPRASAACAVLGALLIVVAAATYSTQTRFPGISVLLPACGAMLMLACPITAGGERIRQFVGLRPIQFLGDISYSLYLWHWPVFAGLRLCGYERSPLVAGSGIIAAILLAVATYYAVENPFRFSRRLQARPGLSIGVCLSMMLVVAGAAAGVRAIAIKALATPAQQRYSDARNDVPDAYVRGCHVNILGETAIPCTDGANEPAGVIVLFGDSHAVQWHPAFAELAKRTGRRLVTFTKSICPSVTVNLIVPSLNRIYTECTTWREAALRKINRLDPELIILSNSQAYFDFAPARIEREWAAGLHDTLNRLTASGANIVVMRDTPNIGFDVPACLSRAAWREQDPEQECRYDLGQAMATHIDRAERTELARFDHAYRLEMTDVICKKSPCPVVQDGQVMFSDDSHLAASFSASLVNEIARRLPPPRGRQASNQAFDNAAR